MNYDVPSMVAREFYYVALTGAKLDIFSLIHTHSLNEILKKLPLNYWCIIFVDIPAVGTLKYNNPFLSK